MNLKKLAKKKKKKENMKYAVAQESIYVRPAVCFVFGHEIHVTSSGSGGLQVGPSVVGSDWRYLCTRAGLSE